MSPMVPSGQESPRDRAFELRAQGLSYRRIAAELSVSQTTVVRWVKPEYAERNRIRSREAKRRRGGTCVDCGAPTRYAGHGITVSERCTDCGYRKSSETLTVWTREKLIAAIQWWNAAYGEPPSSVCWNAGEARHMGDEARARRFEQLHAQGRVPWFTSVVREFGSWNSGIAAAGLTPREQGIEANRHRLRRERARKDFAEEAAG